MNRTQLKFLVIFPAILLMFVLIVIYVSSHNDNDDGGNTDSNDDTEQTVTATIVMEREEMDRSTAEDAEAAFMGYLAANDYDSTSISIGNIETLDSNSNLDGEFAEMIDVYCLTLETPIESEVGVSISSGTLYVLIGTDSSGDWGVEGLTNQEDAQAYGCTS